VPPEMDANYYGLQSWVYQGKLITAGYGGQVRAYDMKTGDITWNYNATTIPFESPYGNNYPVNVGLIADGKIYIGAGEHSPTQPIWRGNVLQCLNATDGSLIWNFPCYGVSQPSGNAGYYFAAADGRLLALNAYDDAIYCFGTGPSATTVSTQEFAAASGEPVLIQGTVTDQSPSGRLDINYNLDVPLKGTPAISDEDMSDWMQYLYQQRPKPIDAKGVPVKLTAMDPNGNFQDIGTAVSDVNGKFAMSWVPPVPGTYHITANFEGSNAYSSSSDTTYVVVAPAASPSIVTPQPSGEIVPTPTPTLPIPTDVTPTSIAPTPTVAPPPTSEGSMTTYVAIGLSIVIIVAAAAALVLRRRK
jgi:outer membrane protein assembly factor BamB